MFKDRYNKLQSSISPDSRLMMQTINQCTEKGAQKVKLRKLSMGVVTAVLILTITVNVSPTFAAQLDKVPIIGAIVRIISLRTYIEQQENNEVIVNQPIVEGLIDVNAAIEEVITAYKENADASIKEYKEAFIATGGTEEQFKEKNIEVVVDYKIMANNETYTSFVIEMYESWLASSARYEYYNLDSQTGEKITISDVLGDNYIEYVNEIIQNEIDQAGTNSLYFAKVDGGFETITDQTAFYINESGNVVIVFEKYEIAAGAAGRPEFEIKK